MSNNVMITIDKEEFVLMSDGKLDVNRLLDLPLNELEQIADELDLFNVDDLEEIEIEEILRNLCRRIKLQKIEISELKARLA